MERTSAGIWADVGKLISSVISLLFSGELLGSRLFDVARIDSGLASNSVL